MAAVVDEHGIPGTLGAPRGQIRRVYDPDAFTDAMWVPNPTREKDLHVVFITHIDLAEAGYYELSCQAAAAFALWIDDDIVVRGPLRFAPALPEFHEQSVHFSAGRHTIAMHAHGEGLMTRMAAPVPLFAWIRLHGRNGVVTPAWRCRELTEFAATGLRVSPLLGWIEWQEKPWAADWRSEPTGLEPWTDPVPVPELREVLGTATRSDLPLILWPRVTPARMNQGRYRESYTGYRFDDLATQFLLADPDPDLADDDDGMWVRYDLEKVRIGTFEFSVTTQSPGEVTVAYAEKLTPEGRPSPVVALSTGPTRFLQHYAIDCGTTRIEPLQALGGRYLEIRVRSSGPAEVSDESFVERDALGEPTGSFQCDDELLNRIWRTGIETLRSSSEDSLVDSVRERGEWVGDVVASALHILTAGWGDHRIVRRALLHSAATARDDGVVAGCGPGGLIYLGTYAAQWVTACLQVAQAEGSPAILWEFEESARANIQALLDLIDADGSHRLPWCFVDWGYGVAPNQLDLAPLTHVLIALRSWITWQRLLHGGNGLEVWQAQERRLSEIIGPWVRKSENPYHSWTLAEQAGLMDAEEAANVIMPRLKSGFPFDLNAPRLRDPEQIDPTTITPYFTNYSMPVVIRAGFSSEVADLWRRGWGWMLDRGATTWWEVFDDRWSTCHFWSGAPTWQMSRFALGLQPDLDENGPLVRLSVNDFGLDRAAGRSHIPGGGWSDIEWNRRDSDTLDYTISLDDDVRVDGLDPAARLTAGRHSLRLIRTANGSYKPESLP